MWSNKRFTRPLGQSNRRGPSRSCEIDKTTLGRAAHLVWAGGTFSLGDVLPREQLCGQVSNEGLCLGSSSL